MTKERPITFRAKSKEWFSETIDVSLDRMERAQLFEELLEALDSNDYDAYMKQYHAKYGFDISVDDLGDDEDKNALKRLIFAFVPFEQWAQLQDDIIHYCDIRQAEYDAIEAVNAAEERRKENEKSSHRATQAAQEAHKKRKEEERLAPFLAPKGMDWTAIYKGKR